MANVHEEEVWHVPYTAEQIQASIGKNPICSDADEDGAVYWMLWDMDTSQYVKSDVKAFIPSETGLQVKYTGGVAALPASANWYSVTYGNGKFVSVAFNSSIAAYSADGITWTQTTMPASTNWRSVAYGNGKFVAIASSSSIAAYSEDGITWTQTTLPTSTNWRSVAYGDGKFVSVAESSSIAAYSENGINWTQTTMPASTNWKSVAYGNGKFVAVAYNTSIAAYSEDGITWTQTAISSTVSWYSVAYGNDKFVAVSSGNTAAYSEDGITWTRTNMPLTTGWESVAYGNGKFVSVAHSSISVAAYSEDGISWTQTTMPVSSSGWFSVAYGNGKFVSVANYSVKTAYSENGITWHPLVVDGYEKDVTDDIAAALQISRTVSASLTASGWTGSGPWTQTVTVAGLTKDSNGIVGPSTSITDAQFTAMQAAALRPTAQAENSLTIKATGTKPTVSLPIQVVIVR